jgi:hypothetical protein
MSDSSRVQMRYLPEVSWGVIPTAAMTNLRMTSESLKYNIGNETSAEIRSDRQVSDLIQTTFDASGDINGELSFATYDPFLESAFYSAFSTPINIAATDISASSSDNSFNSTTTNFTTSNISVGQWIKSAGFTEAANNGFFKVISVAANKVIVSGGTLTTEAAGDNVTIKGSMIRNGTTQKSFVLEKSFEDITQFISFTGMVVNTLALNVESQQKVTTTLGFTGKSATIAQATVGTGAPTAANSNQIFSVGSHVQNVREAAAAMGSVYVKKLNFVLNNNNRPKDAVGQTGAVGISPGTLNVSIDLVVYFENETIYEKFINNTASSLDYRLQDAAGNAYIVGFPNIKYEDGDVKATGINEFVVAEMKATSLLDATQKMIQIDKFAA